MISPSWVSSNDDIPVKDRVRRKTTGWSGTGLDGTLAGDRAFSGERLRSRTWRRSCCSGAGSENVSSSERGSSGCLVSCMLSLSISGSLGPASWIEMGEFLGTRGETTLLLLYALLLCTLLCRVRKACTLCRSSVHGRSSPISGIRDGAPRFMVLRPEFSARATPHAAREKGGGRR